MELYEESIVGPAVDLASINSQGNSIVSDAIESLHQIHMEQPKDRLLYVAMYHLHRILKADYVLAGKILPEDPLKVHTAVILFRGSVIPNIEYELKGSPCEIVVSRNACCFSHSVATMFPDDTFLRTHAIEGYVGAPIVEEQGKRAGLIVALTCRPLENQKEILTLAKLFALAVAPVICSLNDTTDSK